jgi:hypothetical protein
MRLVLMLSVAALAVAVRLPFLVTGKIPFDADEAVEGLMARHVLNGELPVFFWGQAFKGVPEVYVSAAVFAVFGSGVTALKSATLAVFAAFVALQCLLLDIVTSRWLAVAASLLLIAAPPALVFWSLDASAEYMWVMLLGTALILIVEKLRSGQKPLADSREWLAVAGLILGLGFWTHQLIVIYLLPLAVMLLANGEGRRALDLPRPHKGVIALAAVAALYLALAVVAFTTGGFTIDAGGVAIGARAPQKMARIAVGIAAIAVVIHLAIATSRAAKRRFARQTWPAAVGFCAGYLPVIIYSVLVEPARSPARNANLMQLVGATPDIAGNILPIMAGFKIATTERLDIPLAAAIPAAAAVAAYLWSARATMTGMFFPLFVVLVPVLFLASGAYLDTQSYRYLIPWYAGLAVAWAGGSLVLAGGRRSLASAIVAAIAAVHLWQQVLWYQKLQPDERSTALIGCLTRNGIRGGYAEYWTSYKLTFLSNETIIVAPTDGLDRRPAYTAFVRSLPPESRMEDVTRCK